MAQNMRLEMLHEKEMATLHLEDDKAKSEGLDNSTCKLDNSRLGIKMPILPKFHEAENIINGYLTRFERHSENAEWVKWDYA